MREVSFGIDPGSRRAGVAVFEVEDEKLLSIRTIDFNSAACLSTEGHHALPTTQISFRVRIKRMMASLAFYIRKYKPYMIAIETPFMNPRLAGAFGPLYEFRLEFDRLMEREFPTVIISDQAPMRVKKHLKVSSKAKQGFKSEMSDAVASHPVLSKHLPKPVDDMTEHEVDAIAILLTAIEIGEKT